MNAKTVDGRVIYVVPGQGDNPAGALLPLYGSSHEARTIINETLDAVEAALSDFHSGFDPRLVRNILLGDAAVEPIPIGIPQLSAFTTAVCVHRILEREGVRPSAIIGLSLGEIASLVCSGVWSVTDGVRAVLALNSAFRPFEGRGGMVGMLVPEADARTLLDAVGDDELVLACVNAPRQVVVGGPIGALDALATVARQHRIKSHKLPMPYAAHHPALQPAADAFYAETAALPRQNFQAPVYSVVAGRRYTEADDLPRLLADCFVKPYHLPAALKNTDAGDDALYVDLSMTGTMSRCIRAVLPAANVVAPTRAATLSVSEGGVV
jgi:[acyl-carrier-protein] S-malonyltransferase